MKAHETRPGGRHCMRERDNEETGPESGAQDGVSAYAETEPATSGPVYRTGIYRNVIVPAFSMWDIARTHGV